MSELDEALLGDEDEELDYDIGNEEEDALLRDQEEDALLRDHEEDVLDLEVNEDELERELNLQDDTVTKAEDDEEEKKKRTSVKFVSERTNASAKQKKDIPATLDEIGTTNTVSNRANAHRGRGRGRGRRDQFNQRNVNNFQQRTVGKKVLVNPHFKGSVQISEAGLNWSQPAPVFQQFNTYNTHGNQYPNQFTPENQNQWNAAPPQFVPPAFPEPVMPYEPQQPQPVYTNIPYNQQPQMSEWNQEYYYSEQQALPQDHFSNAVMPQQVPLMNQPIQNFDLRDRINNRFEQLPPPVNHPFQQNQRPPMFIPQNQPLPPPPYQPEPPYNNVYVNPPIPNPPHLQNVPPPVQFNQINPYPGPARPVAPFGNQFEPGPFRPPQPHPADQFHFNRGAPRPRHFDNNQFRGQRQPRPFGQQHQFVKQQQRFSQNAHDQRKPGNFAAEQNGDDAKRKPFEANGVNSLKKKRRSMDLKNLHEVTVVEQSPVKQNEEKEKISANVVDDSEDEETKAYRLKIEEQKKMRESVIRQKEERRKLAALKESQKNAVPVKPVAPVVGEFKPKPNKWIPNSPKKPFRPQQQTRTLQAVKILATEEDAAPPRTVSLKGVNTGAPVASAEQLKPEQLNSLLSNRTIISKGGGAVSGNVIADQASLIKTPVVTVSNLSSGTTETKILKMCQGIGEAQTVQLIPNAGQATIRFKNVLAAHSFYRKYHRKIVDLSMIQVRLEPDSDTDAKAVGSLKTV